MPSFSKMAIFPAGYFRATTQWLLRERRDVVARIDTLQAELLRIGNVRVTYAPLKEGAAGIKRSARQTGFTVTKGSSLARLMQAYIATGGNPYDISGFLHPDTTQWVDTADGVVRQEQYPGGGFVAPKSVEYDTPHPEVMSEDPKDPEKSGYESYEGGFVASHRYTPGRMGGRLDRGAWDNATVTKVMHDVRKWANQEIKHRLQNMEWRIIKLSDLHEQLCTERDMVLMEAFAGQLNGMPMLDDTKFDPKRLCQVIIADMYALLYETDASGTPFGLRANVKTGFLQFTYPDVPEDEAGPMG